MNSEEIGEKVKEFFQLYKQIKGLERQVGSIEMELNKGIDQIRSKIKTKENLSNPIHHYCLIDMSFYPDESARTKLEQIPKVELFHKKIKEFKNQKILSLDGIVYTNKYSFNHYEENSADCVEIGIISGPCNFEKGNMHVFIPVKQKFTLKKDFLNWELEESKDICMIQDIFRYLDAFYVKDDIWVSKYPKGKIVTSSDRRAIYLGNKAVDRALRNYQERKVTRMEKITGLEI